MKLKNTIFTSLALCLMTACSFITKTPKLAPDVAPPAAAMQLCPGPVSLAQGANLGELLGVASENAARLNNCRLIHKNLVDFYQK